MAGFETLCNYFENIATQHEAIEHTPSDPRFFLVSLEDAINGECDIEFGGYSLLLPNVTWSPKDDGGEVKQEMDIMFFVLGYVENQDFEAQKQIYIDTEKIVQDILNRIKSDSINEANNETFFYGSQNRIKANVVQTTFPTSIQSRGWQVNIKITPFYSECVDATKWKDL